MTQDIFIDSIMHRADVGATLKDWAYAQVEQDTRDLCGMVSVTFNPLDGSPDRKIFRCKQWRTCPNCALVRDFEVAERIEGFMEDKGTDQVVMRHLTNEEYKRVRRKKGKDNLIRFPKEEYQIVVVHDEPKPGDIIMSVDDFKDSDLLRELSYTALNKRISGWRLPEVEEVESPGLVDVYTRAYMAENPVAMKKLIEDAVKATAYIPEKMAYDWHRMHTDEKKAEVQWALNERENALVNLAREREIPLHQRGWSKKVWINPEEVNWRR